MKAYVKEENYCYVLNRSSGEIDELIQGTSLEGELIDLETNTVLDKKAILRHDRGYDLELNISESKNAVIFFLNSSFVTPILMTGKYQKRYDSETMFYLTDGISAQNFI